jgi:beta-lactamase class A
VKNLNTDESFIINDRPMKSASVMKLFIMGTVYRAFEDGDLERTEEVMALMNNMISVSDNESSNQLLYMLGRGSYQAGIDKVNAFIQEYGFSDMTMEYNGFENAATVMDSSHFNQVSAKDCGKLLEDVYRRVWVSRAASNEIEQMMLNQHTRYKIPRGLPDGVLCGNKTGEMDTTENDAAIIYSENCDYILVVLSSDWSSKDTAITRIATLSGIVYEFLN